MKLNEVIAKYGNQEVDESKIKEVLGVKESKVWKPEYDEAYYLLDDDGDIVRSSANSIKRFTFGNCYKTFEEAEFARDKQMFLTKFERYLRENEDEPVDWCNSNQTKYNIIFDIANWVIIIDSWCRYLNQGAIVTTNRQVLEQFIKDNELDIKKYMFGVE